jgi:hypothetical protein
MQETPDAPDTPIGPPHIEDRPIANIKHLLRASSVQNIPHDPAIDKTQFQEKVMKLELNNSIYSHESSASNRSSSLVERTFPDNAVPFNLKKLLGAKILQFPKPVDGLVDTT